VHIYFQGKKGEYMNRFIFSMLMLWGSFASAVELECDFFQFTIGVGVLKGHCQDGDYNEYKLSIYGLVGANISSGEGTLSCTQENGAHLQGHYNGIAGASFLSGNVVAGGDASPVGFSDGWDTCKINNSSFGLGMSTDLIPLLIIDKLD
jgi:hypothetical protein